MNTAKFHIRKNQPLPWLIVAVLTSCTLFLIGCAQQTSETQTSQPATTDETEPQKVSTGLEPKDRQGPIRVLFLGHPEGTIDWAGHEGQAYFPILAQSLGRDAIYFDFTEDVDLAFSADYLGHFDLLMIYSDLNNMSKQQFKTLQEFVQQGRGLIGVHMASGAFKSQRGYIDMLGAQFKSHGAGVFSPAIVKPDHPALDGFEGFEAWDETYIHKNHNTENRTVLMERVDEKTGKREPWTWVRTEGKGRVFYTASGHDERVWKLAEFHQLLKSGILWAIGDDRRAQYDAFIAARQPLTYEVRGDIPNYEKRPAPLKYQHPLSPKDSMAYMQVPADFELQLVAADPLIVNPISITWDERGRLWVAETVDYPNDIKEEGGNDRILILEDTDKDGLMDTRQVFADGLNIPTAITLMNGGVLVAQAPNFYFMKDTDGDDKADIKDVLFEDSWGLFDTHAGPSNLRYGFDNWIYGAVGYSGFKAPKNEKDNETQQKFGNGLFRMRPDGSKIEFLHQFNNNTWGAGFNAAGDLFGSTANGNPSFWGAIPATIAAKAGVMMPSAKTIADTPNFYPITPNIRQGDWFGAYTSAAGHAFAASDAFPPRMRDNTAFVAGPTGHLLGQFTIERDGAGYSATNDFSFLASADEWVSPILAEVGPDGALYISDWYNFIMLHNPKPTKEEAGYDGELGAGNAHVNPNRDKLHGRIYRAVWKGAKKPARQSLEGASSEDLIEALDDSNMFWRLTAQRLLVESKRTDAVSLLKARAQGEGYGAIHAIWALEGLGALDRGTLKKVMSSKDGAVRKNAVRASVNVPGAVEEIQATGIVKDADPAIRLETLNTLGQLSDASNTAADIVRTALKNDANMEDLWLSRSVKLAAALHGVTPEETGLDIDLGKGESVFAGDPGDGFKKIVSAESGCITCHQVMGIGGKIGPSMSGIGSRRDEAYLRRALLNPSADIAEGYGKPGDMSQMPSATLLLNPQEIEDVIAFLLTLKSDGAAKKD
ncbi:MAG: PVC-type heme-binding CxxCH protein [Pseudomonadota bacterium]